MWVDHTYMIGQGNLSMGFVDATTVITNGGCPFSFNVAETVGGIAYPGIVTPALFKIPYVLDATG